jgi:hypothetical protein
MYDMAELKQNDKKSGSSKSQSSKGSGSKSPSQKVPTQSGGKTPSNIGLQIVDKPLDNM